MRQMKVLGIELKDYGLRESLRMVDLFLKGGTVRTIAYITTRGLMEAEHDESRKAFLGNLDLTIPADGDILRAAGMENRIRLREIDQGEFLEEFLKKLIRLHKTVYLLTEKKEQMDVLKKGLSNLAKELTIVGSYCLEDLEKEDDFLVNEINMELPDVIISNLSSPKREEFYAANHMKLNASIWLMLKDEVAFEYSGRKIGAWIFQRVASLMFQKKVTKYQVAEEEYEEK